MITDYMSMKAILYEMIQAADRLDDVHPTHIDYSDVDILRGFLVFLHLAGNKILRNMIRDKVDSETASEINQKLESAATQLFKQMSGFDPEITLHYDDAYEVARRDIDSM